MGPSAILDLSGAHWDHPRRLLGGLYRCAKFGWNRCSTFDNMKVLIKNWVMRCWCGYMISLISLSFSALTNYSSFATPDHHSYPGRALGRVCVCDSIICIRIIVERQQKFHTGVGKSMADPAAAGPIIMTNKNFRVHIISTFANVKWTKTQVQKTHTVVNWFLGKWVNLEVKSYGQQTAKRRRKCMKQSRSYL